MSDDEETECKITYKEGREIARDVERKRKWKSIRWMIAGFLLCIFLLAFTQYDLGIFLNGGVEALRDKVLEGDMQAVLDYIRYNNALNGCLIMLMIFSIMTAIEFAVTETKVRKALKEANDKKEESP